MGIVEWFKRQTFEGKIIRHIGEVDGVPRHLSNIKIKVDVLDAKEGPGYERVRLDIVATAPLGYRSMPMVLSIDGAMRLAELLRRATSK